MNSRFAPTIAIQTRAKAKTSLPLSMAHDPERVLMWIDLKFEPDHPIRVLSGIVWPLNPKPKGRRVQGSTFPSVCQAGRMWGIVPYNQISSQIFQPNFFSQNIFLSQFFSVP